MATHFSYGFEWYEHLWKLANALSGAHGYCVKLCLDLNFNQNPARQSILCSIGCNIIGLNFYTMPGNNHGVEYWKPEYWETIFYVEDVLNCTKLLTTQSQYETEFTGAFGTLIQHTLMNKLCSNSLSVVDTVRVINSPTVPHREKPVSELSDIGKGTLLRAQLEAECRFCGNCS